MLTPIGNKRQMTCAVFPGHIGALVAFAVLCWCAPWRAMRAPWQHRAAADACVLPLMNCPTRTHGRYYALQTGSETVISYTPTMAGYTCVGLGAFTSASTLIPRATLEPTCPDLVLPQMVPGGAPPTGFGTEVTVNFGTQVGNPARTNGSCPGGAAACAHPFVYISPFASSADNFAGFTATSLSTATSGKPLYGFYPAGCAAGTYAACTQAPSLSHRFCTS